MIDYEPVGLSVSLGVMRGSFRWCRLLSSDTVAVSAPTFSPRGGASFCWSVLLLAWLAYAAAGVSVGASAGGLHSVNPFATGPGRITWVLGYTFGTILLYLQHSGAQFLGVDSSRQLESWWLVLRTECRLVFNARFCHP